MLTSNRARLGVLTAVFLAVVAACTSAGAEQHADRVGAAHASAVGSSTATSSVSAHASTANSVPPRPLLSTAPPSGAGAPTTSPSGRAASSTAQVTQSSKPTSSATKSASPSQRTSEPQPGVSQASDYAITQNRDGSIVRWNPCAPIHYTVNVELAADPAGALADTRAAIDKVAAASGLTFVYDGPTTLVPTHAWLDDGSATSRGLVIAWAARGSGAGRSDLFGGDADGEGGWWESGVSKDGLNWTWQIERGFVVIDPAGAAAYAPGFGPGQSRGVLLMHELGHAVGLGHVDNRRDVMFPVITASSRAQWGPGDLGGLALVGKGAGCIG